MTTVQSERCQTASLEVSSEGSSGQPPSTSGAEPSNRRLTLELLCIFLLALCVRLTYNLWLPHINNFAACDAYEYIQNARALIGLGGMPASMLPDCLAVLSGKASASATHAVQSALSGMKDFAISGPVFPVYLALTLLLGGAAQLPDYAAWSQMLVGQSVMSALTCVLIALTASECFDKRTGRVAGIFSALYPGFIIASGRLYSESFACTLLALLCWFVVRGFRTGGNSLAVVFLSGLTMGSLQLARSVMAVLSLAMVPITLWQSATRQMPAAGLKKRLTALAGVLLTLSLGFAVPAVPWICFQKLAFGGGGLVVDRVGRYNFFVGNNSDIGGWLSYPYPDGRNVESTSFPQLFKNAVAKSSERWFKLMLDKPGRLFKFPWNDFKTPIGPLGHAGQVVFHQMLLMLAAAGVSFATFTAVGSAEAGAPEKKRPRLAGRLFLMGLFLFHCIYYLFITVPRYNLTAIPEVIVFAAAGLIAFVDLSKWKNTKSPMLAVLGFCSLFCILLWSPILALLQELFPGASPNTVLLAGCVFKGVVMLALTTVTLSLISRLSGSVRAASVQTVVLAAVLAPVLCLPVRANGRWFEWCCNLSVSRGVVSQTLRLPCTDQRITERDVYLIFDGDGVRQFADGLSVRVNGLSLKDRPIVPGMALAEDFDRPLEVSARTYQREGERQWDMLAAGAGMGNIDLRQWSLVLLPQDLVAATCARAREEKREYAEFKVELTNGSSEPLKVFGSYKHQPRDRALPSVGVYSWEKCFYGVENPFGLTDTRYDIKAPSKHVLWQASDLSDEIGLQTGAYNMGILLSPPAVARTKCSGVPYPARGGSAGGIRFDSDRPILSSPLPQATLSAQGRDVCEVRTKAPRCASGTLLLARLRGKLKTTSKDVTGAVAIAATYGASNSALVYRSPWVPRCQKPATNWREFEVVVPLPATLVNSSMSSVDLTLSCADPDFGYRNVYKKLQGEATFSDLRLEIYELPSNPLGLGHLVY